MIVVEGPDGSGKSTLVKQLAEDLGLDIMQRATDSDANYTTELDDWVEFHAELAPGARIYDRHQLISHLTYGPTMRRHLFGRFRDPAWLQYELARFWASQPFVIICLPWLETVKENLVHDPHKVAQADIDVFYWNYHIWLAQHSHYDTVRQYDYITQSYPRLRGHVTQYLRMKGIR